MTIKWDKSFSDWAGHVGVTPDEALRKTDYDVYKAVINAAFATDGVNSLNINGAWRPAYSDYKAIYEQQRNDASADQANVATMKKTVENFAANPWSNSHVSSRGVDISSINGIAINNGGYSNGQPKRAEPSVIQDFTDNLVEQPGRKQVIQPWRLWMKSGDVTPISNTGIGGDSGTQKRHSNHLHYGR